MGDHARTDAVSYLSAIISSLSAIENCTKRRDSLDGQRLASLLISYNVTLAHRVQHLGLASRGPRSGGCCSERSDLRRAGTDRVVPTRRGIPAAPLRPIHATGLFGRHVS